ncbi:TetR family transcriptional regulator [Propionicimonas paludicola]|uniref:TetR family transcriptional regulator n=1 Tax=Propionicimonas paludicola TaxID=185243 RepID=A0A2A9CVJ1_9ACTN|nr:TetR/AcrR family transcriptional regulator [Propionicimonas paludicola]PFG18166.1 TetR family transcriptional regulator [Propionicimonas paludicola]
MGRPQEFDTAQAVRAARRVFWEQGYAEASMPDLEDATGVGRSSIYHAFGSKRGLFDAAVISYLDEVVRPRLRPLYDNPVDPDAVVTYLRLIQTAAHQASGVHGCLLINTATSPLGADSAVARAIVEYRAELQEGLAHGLQARFPDRSGASITRLAETLTALLVSAFSTVRADPKGAARDMELAISLATEGS